MPGQWFVQLHPVSMWKLEPIITPDEVRLGGLGGHLVRAHPGQRVGSRFPVRKVSIDIGCDVLYNGANLTMLFQARMG